MIPTPEKPLRTRNLTLPKRGYSLKKVPLRHPLIIKENWNLFKKAGMIWRPSTKIFSVRFQRRSWIYLLSSLASRVYYLAKTMTRTEDDGTPVTIVTFLRTRMATWSER